MAKTGPPRRIVGLVMVLVLLCIPALIHLPSLSASLPPLQRPRSFNATMLSDSTQTPSSQTSSTKTSSTQTPSARTPSTQTPSAPISSAQTNSPVGCVRITLGGQSREGIGAVIKRNQLAIFLASWYDVPLQFPVRDSIHGYQTNEVFGLCPGVKEHPKETNKTGQDEACTMYMKRMALPMCPRPGCRCLFDGVAPYLKPHLDKGCREISVMNDGFKTLAYSGCLNRTLNRYLAGYTPAPAWQYDAIHYRQGDLANGTGGGKALRLRELNYVVRVMCLLSDRDIVVVTEGTPTFPECGDRIVLAGNTTIQEAFRIMKHARVVSVGVSSFAIAMMEVAKPEHVIVRDDDTRKYEWVDCENWTIIARDGGAFHFKSKAAMVRYVFSGRDLRDRTRRSDGMAERDIFNASVPKRHWNVGMMRP